MNDKRLAILLYAGIPFHTIPGAFDAAYARTAKSILELISEKFHLSLFLPGPILEFWGRENIPDVLEMRKAIRDGRLEILGGSFFDAMLPLFPTQLQELQLQKHTAWVEKLFHAEPTGYFNSSFAWEIGLTENLAKSGFRYTLVSDRALQETLGIATPVSGWFTVEDRDSVMRLLPVADRLGEALLGNSAEWDELWRSLDNSKIWTAALRIPVENLSQMELFFVRLKERLSASSCQLWTLNHLLDEPSGGKVNLFSDMGNSGSLPVGIRSCRELLLRRPEADLMHKLLLMANSHGKSLLQRTDLLSVQEKLLPLMAPVYYLDSEGKDGIRNPEVRWTANRQIVSVEREIEKLANQEGRRMEVSDFLRNGSRQILANNSEIQFLLEQRVGASLRSLFFKPAKVNWISSSLQNGDVPRAFVDYLLPPSLGTFKQIDSALNDNLGILNAPYDYRIERDGESLEILLRSEQVADWQESSHVLHVEKRFSFRQENSLLDISYAVSNGTLVDFNGYLGTELNLGIREIHRHRVYSMVIDGKRIPMGEAFPLLYPSASKLTLKDGLLSCAFRLELDSPATISADWILGARGTAAPTEIQGLRLFVFWNLPMHGQITQRKRIRMRFSKRGLFQ